MEIEIKSIADLQKAYEAMKKDLEEKGAENVKNFEEKMTAIETGMKELKEAKPEVTAVELKALKDDLDVTIKAFDRLQIRMKNNTQAPIEKKSFSQALTEAVDKKHDTINKFFRKEIKTFDLEIDMKTVGALSTANVTGSSIWGAQNRNGIVMIPSRKTHVRDLLDVMAAGPGTDYYFMYESGAGEGSIAATSETTAAAAATTQSTGLKPQFDLDLVETSVKFEIIAGWMLLSRKP